MLSEEQKKLVEKFGVVLEKSGLSPAQARVSGLLIIADKVEMTFDEIMNALQLSKSATSNAINSLLMVDQITYSTRPGERKRYFKSKIGAMGTEFERKFDQILHFKTLLQEVLDQRTPETVEFNEKLTKVVEFLAFMQVEMPLVYEKWKKSQTK
jgi:DNA-binding transcriptional regulator GbsR (MarR family)